RLSIDAEIARRPRQGHGPMNARNVMSTPTPFDDWLRCMFIDGAAIARPAPKPEPPVTPAEEEPSAPTVPKPGGAAKSSSTSGSRQLPLGPGGTLDDQVDLSGQVRESGEGLG